MIETLLESTCPTAKWGLPWFLSAPDPMVYFNKPYLVFDFETMNNNKGDPLDPMNTIVCAAWMVSTDKQIKYHRGDEFVQKDLLQDIDRVLDDGGFIVAHNIKFELKWLYRMGYDLRKVLCYDTMIGEYVIGGNQWMFQKLGLNTLDVKYGGTGKMKLIDALMKGGVCPSQMDPDLLEARVRKDVVDCNNILIQQLPILHQRKQLHLVYTRNLLTPCLAHIEWQGMALDEERVTEEYDAAERELREINEEIDTITGGINWRSGPQKAKFLYGKEGHEYHMLDYPGLGFAELKKGSKPIRNKGAGEWRVEGIPKTDAATLNQLKAVNNKQEKFIELIRRAAKVDAKLSKTLLFVKGVLNQYDGKFFGEFNQCNTATHRLSSNGKPLHIEGFKTRKSVQFQNFPRVFKDLIRAKKKNSKIAETDGSQLEFRGVAFLTQDPVAISNIRNDVDIHLFTAEKLFEVAMEAVTKYMRTAAKTHTFKPLYGGQSGTEAEQRYYAAFREKYHVMDKVMEGWCADALINKKVRTTYGMEYYFPTCKMSKSGYISDRRNIFNYPVQGFATAECIPISVIHLWHRLGQNDAESEIVNTVHDSAIGEVVENEEPLWCALSLQAFTMDVYKYLKEVYKVEFNVPLGAGISIGDRWQSPDTVESEINVEPDGSYWFKGSRSGNDENIDSWKKLAKIA